MKNKFIVAIITVVIITISITSLILGSISVHNQVYLWKDVSKGFTYASEIEKVEIFYDIPQTKVLSDTVDIQKLINCFSTAVYKKTSIAKTDRIFHIKLYLKNGKTAKILPRGNDIQINNLQFTANSHFNNLLDKLFENNLA